MKHVLDSFIENFWFAPQDAFLRAAEASIWSRQVFLPPVLDIGCGDGHFSKFLFKNQGEIEVGVDIDKNELKKAKNCRVYRKIVLANAERLPFGDGSFRTVVSNSTFEHIENDILAVAEVSRVLRKGGHFLFTVPLPRLTSVLKQMMKNKDEFARFNERVSHRHYRSYKEWRDILAKYGLKSVAREDYFPKETVRVWYRLFKLATFRPYKRELWSYLKDSPYGKLVPSGAVKWLLQKYTHHSWTNIFNPFGCWLFIRGVKEK
ncbi:class I SAM-dependent methyltransferase [Candidatus Gottesmanbacteria bacterium]|nr:class I SAM-dependent methyltransferase [Candidatus Gottesmanbacteria bacterium]